MMTDPIKAVLFPLYLSLYDRVTPDLRGKMLPFLQEVRDFIAARGVALTDFGSSPRRPTSGARRPPPPGPISSSPCT